ncbi:ABC transporter permease [Pseudobacteroides cellulosolvens]|uniref:ABC-2 type transporter n=1 Tax=Pseudobacteroides cellulosolvens ATCC 35603 = DSM 2933 TaxID=398512 RepID=A0A0L6JTW8_9FIRM|nr:ABC transporter permease [Pseudobacteroides cellulosolvens]KNY29248.1 hypothetical protein Bccel_4522 [Pseudobacteroides cellulosolvens ATCC 35603 = DSM 2933]
MQSANKALLYKDWKYGKWFFPILTLELFILFGANLIYLLDIGQPKIKIYLDQLPTHIVTLFIITVTLIFMSSILFRFERKTSTYTFASSLPFKREEIITSKWMVGIYNIILSYFLVYSIMNIQLILNFCWDKYFADITIWFIAYTSLSILIFSFIMFIQSMNGSILSGSILVIIFGAFPFTLVFLIANCYNNYSTSLFLSNLLGSKISPNFDFMMLNIYRAYSLIRDWSGGLLGIQFAIMALSIVLIMISYVFFRLSRVMFVKNHFERVGKITVVPKFERFIRPILFYYLGFIITLISAFVFNNTKYFFRIDIVIVLCLILPIVLSLSYNKLSKMGFRVFFKGGHAG